MRPLRPGQWEGLQNRITAHVQGVPTRQFAKDLTEAFQTVVAKTGDAELARRNLELYGKTATATRARVQDVAAIGAEFQKLKLPDQTIGFAIAAKQADVGAMELRDLVTQGPRIISAMANAGLKGEQGLRRGGALFQVAAANTGSPEMAATAVENIFADVSNKRSVVKQLGVDVFNPKTHDPNERVGVILDVIRKAKGREDVLRQIFGEQSIRLAGALARDFRETGKFTQFETFANVDAGRDLLDQKFALQTQTAMSKIKLAQIRAQTGFDRNLGDKVESAAGASGAMASVLNWGMANPGTAALATLALRVGGGMALKGAGRLLGRGGTLTEAAAGATGSALGEALSGATPVRVVNWPMGALGAPGENGVVNAIDQVGEKAKGGLLAGARTFVGQSVTSAFTGGGAAMMGSAFAVAGAGIIGWRIGTAFEQWLDRHNNSSVRSSAKDREQQGLDPTDIQAREQHEDQRRQRMKAGEKMPASVAMVQEQESYAKTLERRLKISDYLQGKGKKVDLTRESALAQFDRFVAQTGGETAKTAALRQMLNGGKPVITPAQASAIQGEYGPAMPVQLQALNAAQTMLTKFAGDLKDKLLPSDEELARQFSINIVVNKDGSAEATATGGRSPKVMAKRSLKGNQ